MRCDGAALARRPYSALLMSSLSCLLLHLLDQEAQLLLHLVERLAVEIGDAGLHVEDGGHRLEEILARRVDIIDEGFRQVGVAVARRAALDVGRRPFARLPDRVQAEDAGLDRSPGQEIDQPAWRDPAPLRPRLGRVRKLPRRALAQRPPFDLVHHVPASVVLFSFCRRGGGKPRRPSIIVDQYDRRYAKSTVKFRLGPKMPEAARSRRPRAGLGPSGRRFSRRPRPSSRPRPMMATCILSRKRRPMRSTIIYKNYLLTEFIREDVVDLPPVAHRAAAEIFEKAGVRCRRPLTPNRDDIREADKIHSFRGSRRSDQLGAASAGAADKVVVGYQTDALPSSVAIANGEFDKATGVKIDFRRFNSGAEIFAAIASGDAMSSRAHSPRRPCAASTSVSTAWRRFPAILRPTIEIFQGLTVDSRRREPPSRGGRCAQSAGVPGGRANGFCPALCCFAVGSASQAERHERALCVDLPPHPERGSERSASSQHCPPLAGIITEFFEQMRGRPTGNQQTPREPGARTLLRSARGIRNGSSVCTQRELNRSRHRLSCTAVAVSPSRFVSNTDRA